MNANIAQPAHHRVRRFARWVVLVPALLAPPMAAWQSEYFDEFVLAAAVYYALFAVLLDSWLVLCTVGGVLSGLWLDPIVKSGPADAQRWQTARCLAGGTLFGVFLGFIFDNVRADAPRVHSPDAPPADAGRQRA